MRLSARDVTLVGIMATGLMLFVGCGGTSSETPEPARPDSWQLKLRHQHQLAAAAETGPNRELSRADNFEPTPTPRSTWGTEGSRGKKTPVARLPTLRDGDAEGTTDLHGAAQVAQPNPARANATHVAKSPDHAANSARVPTGPAAAPSGAAAAAAPSSATAPATAAPSATATESPAKVR